MHGRWLCDTDARGGRGGSLRRDRDLYAYSAHEYAYDDSNDDANVDEDSNYDAHSNADADRR